MEANLIGLIGTLLGAGLGSWFGIRGALNGIKDTTRQTLREVQEHRRDSVRYVAEIRRDVERTRDGG
jgi:hypothetical protein